MAKIDWTAELESSVIEAIQSGSTLRKVGAEKGFSASCIVEHAENDPEFREQYARALLIRADLDIYEIDELVNEEPERGKFGIDPGWANWQRTRIDAKKWLAGKRNPKKYGEKTQVDMNVTGELQIAERLAAARKARIGPKELSLDGCSVVLRWPSTGCDKSAADMQAKEQHERNED